MAYVDNSPAELTLRDQLARDRTMLANERTLLSYLRTAFCFFAGGGTLLKLFPEDQPLRILGACLLFAGLLLLLAGSIRFAIVHRRMKSIMAEPPKRN